MGLRAASLGLVVAVGTACGEEAPSPSRSEAPEAPTGEIHRSTDKPVDPPDNGAPSASYPAPHADAPTVVSLGGPVLPHPRIVPVTFAGDAYADEIGTFLQAMATSAYWKNAVAEYGVGEAEIGEAVIVEETPSSPVDDEATAAWLITQIDALDSFAAPVSANAQTVYALFYPRGTLLSGSRWGKGCVDFAGYHWEAARADGSHVPYVVIPRCASWQDLHGFDVVTTATSHEMIEAVTDPFPQSAPAFAALDADHQVWQLFPFGELADMCTADGDSAVKPADLAYTVQRTWSNAAARAHHDPCGIGATQSAYFNSVPAMPDDVMIEMVTHSASTKGVKIPLGESRTIEIDLFSDGPTKAPWIVTPKDVSSLGGRLPSLSFQLDRDRGMNGEKLHLTITAVREGQSGGAEFMLVSSLDDARGTQTSTWFGFVANASPDPGSAPVR